MTNTAKSKQTKKAGVFYSLCRKNEGCLEGGVK